MQNINLETSLLSALDILFARLWWILDTGYWTLDTGYSTVKILDTG